MRIWQIPLIAALTGTAIGCRHKPTQVATIALPPSPTIALDKAPEPKTPLVVPTVPAVQAPVATVTPPPKKVKKPRKKPIVPLSPTATPAPEQVASSGAAPSPGSVIGALTAGGDDTPEKHQRAADLLASIDKRLASLAPDVLNRQKQQIQRVRYFASEARDALKAGDADGAMTLATKAKVLLDDVEK